MSSEVQVFPVTCRREIKHFIKFPYTLYKDYPNWVPPLIKERMDFLNPKKNPFFKNARVKLFLARSENKIVGRIAATVNHIYLKFYGEKAGFFGFFESINNYQVAKSLFDAVVEFLKAEGMESVQGPTNFSTNHDCGLLIEGFELLPSFMMTYNPEYYQDFIERYGFVKTKDLLAYLLNFKEYRRGKQKLAEAIRKKRKVIIRSINLDDFKKEVEHIKEIYNSAWQNNWGFIPMTDEEFSWMAENLKKIFVKDLLLLAEIDGEMVGFSLNVPDINIVLKKINGRLLPFGIFKILYYMQKVNKLRGLTLGIVEKYRKIGLDILFYEEIIKIALKKGFDKEEISWVLEDNKLVNRTLEKAGAKLYKKYRIYSYNIG